MIRQYEAITVPTACHPRCRRQYSIPRPHMPGASPDPIRRVITAYTLLGGCTNFVTIRNVELPNTGFTARLRDRSVTYGLSSGKCAIDPATNNICPTSQFFRWICALSEFRTRIMVHNQTRKRRSADQCAPVAIRHIVSIMGFLSTIIPHIDDTFTTMTIAHSHSISSPNALATGSYNAGPVFCRDHRRGYNDENLLAAHSFM